DTAAADRGCAGPHGPERVRLLQQLRPDDRLAAAGGGSLGAVLHRLPGAGREGNARGRGGLARISSRAAAQGAYRGAALLATAPRRHRMTESVHRLLAALGQDGASQVALVHGDLVLAEPAALEVAEAVAARHGGRVEPHRRPPGVGPLLQDLRTFSMFGAAKVLPPI